jgi:(p)ppGpp synthase/HD superfamily hydrolase
LNLVREAENFARCAHDGQKRKYSGLPYIVHPEAVANTVAEYTCDEEVVAAAWLHDVVEDCKISPKELTENFGTSVCTLVLELTNSSKSFPELSRKERKRLDREDIANASPDAQLIKVIDRIKNLEDMIHDNCPSDFKVVYGRESLLLAYVLKHAPQTLINRLKSLANQCINKDY